MKTNAIPDPMLDAEQARLSAQALDQSLHASLSKLTSGLSPVSLALAYTDWAMHLASSPGFRSQLARSAIDKALTSTSHSLPPTPWPPQPEQTQVPAAPQTDARFKSEEWGSWPFSNWVSGFKAAEEWWQEATNVPGVARHNKEVVNFFARQWLDMLSPSNWPVSPEVLHATQHSNGQNLVQGAQNFLDDWREMKGLPALDRGHKETFKPGKNVAITEGQVVYRNHLCELIQYSPATPQVHAEPVLIVPSWVMKYYILDLSPHNSMVRYLVEQGHTVFMISWHNPDKSDAHLGLNDYVHDGVFSTLQAIGKLCPKQAVHAMGYCLGGTLLAIGAARLAGDQPLAEWADMPSIRSITLLAAEVDFTEPGEMGVFIDPAQVRQLMDTMAEQGFLTGKQMGGSFQFLHSRDLIWSRQMHEYLLGERTQPNDLMAWNADVTRMPATMHGEYLTKLFLDNELAEGRYVVDGEAVSLQDIRVPMMVVSTEKDHVSPWKSVYKINRLTETEITFVLASGGHNAGIVSEPGHPHRHYRIRTAPAMAPWKTPEEWLDETPVVEGSWWPAWQSWWASHSSGQVKARQIPASKALYPAPGHNVMVCYAD